MTTIPATSRNTKKQQTVAGPDIPVRRSTSSCRLSALAVAAAFSSSAPLTFSSAPCSAALHSASSWRRRDTSPCSCSDSTPATQAATRARAGGGTSGAAASSQSHTRNKSKGVRFSVTSVRRRSRSCATSCASLASETKRDSKSCSRASASTRDALASALMRDTTSSARCSSHSATSPPPRTRARSAALRPSAAIPLHTRERADTRPQPRPHDYTHIQKHIDTSHAAAAPASARGRHARFERRRKLKDRARRG
jgi:hypothetical protein